MKQLVQALVALLLAGTGFAATTGTAWARPCAGGERISGSTPTHWICMDQVTGDTRLVLK